MFVLHVPASFVLRWNTWMTMPLPTNWTFNTTPTLQEWKRKTASFTSLISMAQRTLAMWSLWGASYVCVQLHTVPRPDSLHWLYRVLVCVCSSFNNYVIWCINCYFCDFLTCSTGIFLPKRPNIPGMELVDVRSYVTLSKLCFHSASKCRHTGKEYATLS